MTASEVLFDTWAWCEVLWDTPVGRRLRKRYFDRQGVRVHTSVLSLTEIGVKLTRLGSADRIGGVFASIQASSTLQPVDHSIAESAVAIREELRRRSPDAGTIDALLLATSRSLGARLVSGDRAFSGEPDVVQL